MKLREYQKRMVDFIVSKKRSLIAAECGLGKTATVLEAIDHLPKPVLIVGPLRVVQTVWENESELWAHPYTFSRVLGSAIKRIEGLQEDADIYLINIENLVWLRDRCGKKGHPFKTIIFDESSLLKSPGAKRTRAAMTMANRADAVVLLSGTPAPKSLLDLYSQVKIIDGGTRLGRSMRKYKMTHFYATDYMQYNWAVRPGHEEKIYEALSDVMVSLKAEDYLELPDMVINNVMVAMGKADKAYAKLLKEMYLEVDDSEIDAVSAGVLVNKLAQYCISEGTEVLTDSGWMVIEKVTGENKVWDGEVFVSCDGVVYNGDKPTVTVWGVDMTRDHLVMTQDGWVTAGEIVNEQNKRYARSDFRLPYSSEPRWEYSSREYKCGDMEMPLCVRERGCAGRREASINGSQAPLLWVHARGVEENSWANITSSVQQVVKNKESVLFRCGQRLSELWWKGCQGLRPMVEFSKFLRRFNRAIQTTFINRQSGCEWGLLSGELPLCYSNGAREQYKIQQICERHDGNASIKKVRVESGDNIPKIKSRVAREQGATSRVYDILNAGDKNRFLVRNSEGHEFIVHNCSGACYVDDGNDYVTLHDAKLKAFDDIVEESIGQPILLVYNYKHSLDRIQARHDVVRVDERSVKLWNDGHVPILAIHQSAGHGLNLQAGGNTVVWFDATWNAEAWIQTNARLHRSGQTKPVIVHKLIAEGTIDEQMSERVGEKVNVQNLLMAAMKQ